MMETVVEIQQNLNRYTKEELKKVVRKLLEYNKQLEFQLEQAILHDTNNGNKLKDKT